MNLREVLPSMIQKNAFDNREKVEEISNQMRDEMMRLYLLLNRKFPWNPSIEFLLSWGL